MPNKLLNETSPYLKQHAHNPVDWHPWNEATLAKAKALDRMLLISIGYSACHWCHVMERESFEDKEVARLMNEHFVCIKVDREERPDVDMVYMNAVQLITGSGGWPLNCFALPDGRPFFGGTYFRKEQWKSLVENIAVLFETRRHDLESQAEALTQGIRREDLFKDNWPGQGNNAEGLTEALTSLKNQFDVIHGGLSGAPKFPMPVVWEFILDWATREKDHEMTSQIHLTLRKMAFGGIYDQIGGGFARYSTDSRWHVPHFEKMLYDNAQLASLYSRAFQVLAEPLYREVVEETLEFIGREMTSQDGLFYSALDADSEGEEGKFYTWTEPEIREILGKQAESFIKYYNVGGKGLWEGGRNILLRASDTLQGFKPLEGPLKKNRQKLLKARSKRTRPGLDNKVLTSWNALMAKGYVDAHLALGRPEYLETALRSAGYLLENAGRPDGGLYHDITPKPSQINGFLEDYALVTDLLWNLYQASFDEFYLRKALSLADYTLQHFYDPGSGLFFFTSDLDPALVARKTEFYDNVIPSSNSVMARNLRHLGIAFDRTDFLEISGKMLEKVKPLMNRHPAAFSNWAALWSESTAAEVVIAVCGPAFREKIHAIRQYNIPGILYFGSEKPSELPYLQNRFVEGMTLIYYCTGKECKLPTEDTNVINNFLKSELRTQNSELKTQNSKLRTQNSELISLPKTAAPARGTSRKRWPG
jgi:uncharacterized protein YyaL (SSP411 family)